MSSFLPFGATNPRPAKIDNTAGVNTANSAEPVFGNSCFAFSWAFGASATAGTSAGVSFVAVWAEFAEVLGLIPAGVLAVGASWSCADCVDEACVPVDVFPDCENGYSGTSFTAASTPLTPPVNSGSSFWTKASPFSALGCSTGLVSSFGAGLFASFLSSSAAFLFNSSINASACFTVNPFSKPSTICFLVTSDAAFKAAIVSAFAFASSGLFVSAFSNSAIAAFNAAS